MHFALCEDSQFRGKNLKKAFLSSDVERPAPSNDMSEKRGLRDDSEMKAISQGGFGTLRLGGREGRECRPKRGLFLKGLFLSNKGPVLGNPVLERRGTSSRRSLNTDHSFVLIREST